MAQNIYVTLFWTGKYAEASGGWVARGPVSPLLKVRALFSTIWSVLNMACVEVSGFCASMASLLRRVGLLAAGAVGWGPLKCSDVWVGVLLRGASRKGISSLRCKYFVSIACSSKLTKNKHNSYWTSPVSWDVHRLPYVCLVLLGKWGEHCKLPPELVAIFSLMAPIAPAAVVLTGNADLGCGWPLWYCTIGARIGAGLRVGEGRWLCMCIGGSLLRDEDRLWGMLKPALL